MDFNSNNLKKLLRKDLPLDRVGPNLRYAVKRALHTGDPQGMLLIGRVVVTELLRRGDLLRTAVEGDTSKNSAYFLIKGTNQLVDLAIFGETATKLSPEYPKQGPLEVPKAILPQIHQDLPGPSLSDYAGMLGAMEQAQDLELGSYHSGESYGILSGILILLRKFTPQFRLFIMYDNHDPIPESATNIFPLPQGPEGNSWLSMRKAGHSVWIPTPLELPRDICKTIKAEEESHSESSFTGRFSPCCAVAVPIMEPLWEKSLDQKVPEVGLLFLVAKENWGRDPMLGLATRFSSFVTSRWQHQKEVNQKINKDGLTGVYNRAYFDNHFTIELERSRRSESPLTLVIADLDNFKQINDTMGHQTGDLMLIMVARRLQEELRRIDNICRIGGEEFALILPDTSQEEAVDVMNRLLNAPFTEKVVHQGEVIDLPITFSYGAVSYPGCGKDAFELYRKADSMLYLSKDKGRNQCHFWNNEGNHLRLIP